MKLLGLVFVILLIIPCSIARETITGSFTLRNSEPSVSLEIVKGSLKIDVSDANGFRDIDYVNVVLVDENGEFSDFAVFEQSKDMDSVYYYDLKNFDDSEIEVIVGDGENEVSSTISYSQEEDNVPLITGLVVLNDNIKGYFSGLWPYLKGLFNLIFG